MRLIDPQNYTLRWEVVTETGYRGEVTDHYRILHISDGVTEAAVRVDSFAVTELDGVTTRLEATVFFIPDVGRWEPVVEEGPTP